MRKLLVGIGAVTALLAIGLGWLAWSDAVSLGNKQVRAQVSETIANTPPGGSFTADSLVREPWDALYIFGPYTSPHEVRETLGFGWDRADNADMSLDDGNCLLVFTTGDSVVTYAKIPRLQGDFSKAARPSAYRPGASFTKVPDPADGNWPYIVVV